MSLEIATTMGSLRIAVIGDVMIDIYLEGEVSRISPEAPVPVVRLSSERFVAGGAANVAANIASIGAFAHLVGVVGDDGGLAMLTASLHPVDRVDLSGIIVDSMRKTTRKVRVIGARQQLVRFDTESDSPFHERIERAIIANAAAAIDASDVVILSDYGKGMLNDRILASIFERAAACQKKVIVDPKRSDFSAYRGATIITPNRAELTKATGLICDSDEEAQAAAAVASNRSGADIVLTRSEKGMSFFPIEGKSLHLPTVAREVFDVSGAGDTVVAILATTLAAGEDVASAMKIANHAAGIVVGKAGTATLTHAELFESLGANDLVPGADGHLATLEEARRIRETWRSKGYTVGIANGCFDLLHPGHVSLIDQATQVCDRLIVALNTDESVRRLKGPTRPVQKQRARAHVVGAIKGVALTVFFDEDTPLKLIEALRPEVLIKGEDYLDKEVVGRKVVESYGGTVFLARLVDGQSSTRLINAAK